MVATTGRTQWAAVPLQDKEVLNVALDTYQHYPNDLAFYQLWHGEVDGHDSTSEARLALLKGLAYYTSGRPEQMNSLFEASPFYTEHKQGEVWPLQGASEIATVLSTFKEPGYCPGNLVKVKEGSGFYFRNVDPEATTRAPLKIQSGGTIRNLDIPPMRWAVDQLLPEEGVVLMAGRPKEGKSWFTLQVALAIGSGQKAMGRYEVIEGKVLYLALEDNDRRIKERLNTLDVPASDNAVDFAYDFVLDNVGIEELERAVEEQSYKVIIIDTFLNADGSPPAGRSADLVKDDYRKINALKKLAFRLHICVVLVCHTRKKTKGDEAGSLDQVLGTTGITAAADLIIMLEGVSREHGKRTSRLHVTGKDTAISDALAMTLDPLHGGWNVDGIAGLTDLSKERQEILQFITSTGAVGADRPMIQRHSDKSKATINKHLKYLVDNFQIARLDSGAYVRLTADQRAEQEGLFDRAA